MRNVFLILLSFFVCFGAYSQGIDPAAGGGFETGTTFASNGWTTVNSSSNGWYVGSTAGPYAGSRSAFISNSGGSSFFYDHEVFGQFNTSHMYRDVAIPAGATGINLSWYMKGNGEVGWDRLFVSYGPTSVTPVANSPVTNSTSISGATLLFTQSSFYSSYTLQSFSLPNALAGTTVRIIFTWQNDDNTGSDPPVSVDNISLTYTPLTPSITVSPASIAFGAVTDGGSSSAMPLTVSGANLTGFPGNITVSAPAPNFQISYEGVFWSSSITLPYTSAILSPVTVFVRCTPSSGAVSGNVTVSGGGAPSVNVPVSGNGVGACTGSPTAGTASISPSSGNSVTRMFSKIART